MKDNIQLPDELRIAVKVIKKAILQSQYRAAKSVNREQLSLYFGIGRYISEHSGKGFWGKGAIKQISEQLHKELPGMRGFGESSLKNMRQFYEEWSDCIIRQPMAGELPKREIQVSVANVLETIYTTSLIDHQAEVLSLMNS